MLATVSGCSGLAYEILFVRLFSNYFGNSFVISGVTVCAVFLGMAFGAWHSHRFMLRLGVIELSIGLFALAVSTLFSLWGFDIAGWGRSAGINAIKIAILLGLPSFLIGTCVPLFTRYVQAAQSDPQGAFTRIYGLYNLGALLSILLLEFTLFRAVGLQLSCYIIGCVNLIIGVILVWRHTPPTRENTIAEPAKINLRLGAALFILSGVSGIFQLLMLRLSFSIFGPLQENFSIILAAAIAGVAIGSWIASLGRVQFRDLPLWVALLLLITLIFVPAVVQGWSLLSGVDLGDRGETLAKVILLTGLPLPLFVLFGMLVPLAVQAYPEAQKAMPGRLLAVSSLGNGLGALAMFLVIYRVFEVPQIGVGLAGLALVSAVLVCAVRPGVGAVLKGAIIAGALVYAGLNAWPERELLLGYRYLAEPEGLRDRLQRFSESVTYKSYDQSASVVRSTDGTRSLMFNGYHSLSFGPGGKSDLHETIVGATPALFVDTAGTALVLGLGTGISAGASAQVFEQTDVVEINPAILHIPHHFEDMNFDVMARPDVDVILDDGLSVLLKSVRRYDAIINTVTSPKYYAASKLYTMDFLQTAKAGLTNKGVYSTWFDLGIDLDGISIMLNTLEQSFAQCRYFVLTGTYFNAVCADHPLIYQPSPVVQSRFQSAGFGALFQRNDLPADITGTLESLEISFSEGLFHRLTDQINTLDRPLIEFVVARQKDRDVAYNRLAELLAANIEQQRRFSLGRQEWRAACRNISAMSYLEFSVCEQR